MPDPKRCVAIGKIGGEVAFEDVTFAYQTGQDVLHGISFTAQPGTVTALYETKDESRPIDITPEAIECFVKKVK